MAEEKTLEGWRSHQSSEGIILVTERILRWGEAHKITERSSG